MNTQQLQAAFAHVNGASFVGIDTLTQVKLSGGKANPQQGRVTKRMTGASVMCFQNKTVNGYEAMVERRLKAEGKDPQSFVLGARAWGTRLPNSPLIEHTKDGAVQHYVEVIFLKPGATEYLLDGVVVPKASIVGIVERDEAPESQGGLDNKVVVRSYAAASLTAVRVDGTTYT